MLKKIFILGLLSGFSLTLQAQIGSLTYLVRIKKGQDISKCALEMSKIPEVTIVAKYPLMKYVVISTMSANEESIKKLECVDLLIPDSDVPMIDTME